MVSGDFIDLDNCSVEVYQKFLKVHAQSVLDDIVVRLLFKFLELNWPRDCFHKNCQGRLSSRDCIIALCNESSRNPLEDNSFKKAMDRCKLEQKGRTLQSELGAGELADIAICLDKLKYHRNDSWFRCLIGIKNKVRNKLAHRSALTKIKFNKIMETLVKWSLELLEHFELMGVPELELQQLREELDNAKVVRSDWTYQHMYAMAEEQLKREAELGALRALVAQLDADYFGVVGKASRVLADALCGPDEVENKVLIILPSAAEALEATRAKAEFLKYVPGWRAVVDFTRGGPLFDVDDFRLYSASEMVLLHSQDDLDQRKKDKLPPVYFAYRLSEEWSSIVDSQLKRGASRHIELCTNAGVSSWNIFVLVSFTPVVRACACMCVCVWAYLCVFVCACIACVIRFPLT